MAQAHIHEHPAPAIPIARGGPITTDTLASLLPQARRAAYDMTPEFGEFMLMTFAPIVEELIQRRRAMDLIHDVANPENVVELYPGEVS